MTEVNFNNIKEKLSNGTDQERRLAIPNIEMFFKHPQIRELFEIALKDADKNVRHSASCFLIAFIEKNPMVARQLAELIKKDSCKNNKYNYEEIIRLTDYLVTDDPAAFELQLRLEIFEGAKDFSGLTTILQERLKQILPSTILEYPVSEIKNYFFNLYQKKRKLST